MNTPQNRSTQPSMGIACLKMEKSKSFRKRNVSGIARRKLNFEDEEQELLLPPPSPNKASSNIRKAFAALKPEKKSKPMTAKERLRRL